MLRCVSDVPVRDAPEQPIGAAEAMYETFAQLDELLVELASA